MTNPRLQAEKSANYEDFTDIVMYLLNAAWGKDWGTFCEAFPNGTDPTSVQFPVITYLLKEMRPGVVGNGQTREIKPRLRGTFIEDKGDDTPKATEVYGRMLDCDFLFEVWEENNAKATVLAQRFLSFMDMYTGYIKSQGVKEVIFQTLNTDMETGGWKDNIVGRKLQYYVRFEHLNEVPSDVLEKVTGIVSARAEMSDDYINQGPTFNLGENS